jgi:hypothetical protein
MPRPTCMTLPRGRGGQVLFVTAATLLALLGFAALSIDIGLLYHARTEAQRTADAAALAGAGAMLQSPGDLNRVRNTIIGFASANTIRGDSIVLLPEDVEVLPDSQLVRVRIVRNAERGSAVPTLFARALGFSEINVQSEAWASSFPAGAVNCLLPLAIPDRWSEGPGLSNWPSSTDTFQPLDGDIYLPPDPLAPSSPGTGFGRTDVGSSLALRGAVRGAAPRMGRYVPIQPPGVMFTVEEYKYQSWECRARGPGANGSWTSGSPVGINNSEWDDVEWEAAYGARRTLERNPDARWDAGCQCATGNPAHVSARTFSLPLFAPPAAPTSSSPTLTVSGFAGFFLERVDPSDALIVRLVHYAGTQPAENGSPLSGSLARVLRLVQ